MGLNAQDKHTQLRVVFIFTFQCQSAQSGARVWQHGAMLSHSVGLASLGLCDLEPLLPSVLVTKFVRANSRLARLQRPMMS